MGILSSEPTEQERREAQRRENEHQMNLNASQAEGQAMDRTYINEMTDHELDQGTVDIMSNLLDRDFMLGNLSDAEVHEYRWLARVVRLEIESLHPNEESIWQGNLRAVAFDDRSDALPALSEQDLSIIEQFLMAVIARATRGKDGWQQEMFNKTISASERREVGGDDDGGFL
ncbi:hypothetical protein AFNJKBDN_CDS0003 [Halorubrum virus V_ICIS4]|nr:hypothetical protein AFNJKBDN_CDS0003 [Halorubrum virus V_ICIS4]